MRDRKYVCNNEQSMEHHQYDKGDNMTSKNEVLLDFYTEYSNVFYFFHQNQELFLLNTRTM